MKADKININAVKFGIMCNFTPFCGEERAREAVELIRELERLAEIGKAKEEGVEVIWDDEDMYCGNCDNYVYDDENYCKECGTKLLIHGRDIP
jgi:hypothetical protein